jgi:hypothetical protein
MRAYSSLLIAVVTLSLLGCFGQVGSITPGNSAEKELATMAHPICAAINAGDLAICDKTTFFTKKKSFAVVHLAQQKPTTTCLSFRATFAQYGWKLLEPRESWSTEYAFIRPGFTLSCSGADTPSTIVLSHYRIGQ